MFYRIKRTSSHPAWLAVLSVCLLLSLLVGCSSEDSAPSGGPNNSGDSTPPTVSNSTPTNSATGVSINQSVTVTFSEDVDPTSVTTATFYIVGVSGSVSVSGNQATFTPDNPLSSNTSYTVMVTEGVKDTAGNPLTSSYSYTFKTASVPVAVAGMDQEASFGDVVTLNGSQSSDPDNNSLTYSWTQLNGTSVGVLSGVAPQFNAPTKVRQLFFELTVSNGAAESAPDTVMVFVLEDADNAYFVSPNGNDGNAGTRTAPFATVQAAINASNTVGIGGDVYVAAGTYNESINLYNNISLYGGFNADDWSRDMAMYESKIMGGTYAVRVANSNNLTIEGMSIESADATTGGSSSVAVSLSNAQNISILSNTLKAGSGYVGGNGSQPNRPSKAGNGSGGSDAYFAFTCGNAGGSGGSSSVSRWGGYGGYSGGAGGGGAGGDGYGGDGISGGNGGSTVGFAKNGDDGDNGNPGTKGADGAGGVEFGTVSNGYYYTSSGSYGARGKHGSGGGGGGGGGAGAACSGSGGGGGSGGVGGSGGSPGVGGGGSFGIILSNNSTAVINNNNITTADGGDGGYGGRGATGGAPGSGAGGGDGNANGGAGGDGGNGGNGGQGGYGGCGGGGPTIGIVESDSESTRENNVIVLGNPGSGGVRADEAGNEGLDGDKAEFKKISTDI